MLIRKAPQRSIPQRDGESTLRSRVRDRCREGSLAEKIGVNSRSPAVYPGSDGAEFLP